MQGWKRRALGYLAFVGVALVATAVGYQWGMDVYEGRPQTFIDSLQFAVEMFTTTGFGGDAPWESPQMNAFITVVDLIGMAILVGALPVFVGPLVESTLSPSAPERLETTLEDHVVICSDTTRAEELIKELEANAVPYVMVEPDGERADELYDDGHRVINADPESTEGLAAAGLPSARALFADVSDRIDASIVLAAKELAGDVPIVSVIEDPETETYHRLAGADHVLSPRSLLGESLAAKVTAATRTEIEEAITVSEGLQLAEISIRHGSNLAGKTLADSGIRERSGVNVIGVWIHGEFSPAPAPDIRLAEGSVLLVSGRADQLRRFVDTTQFSLRKFQTGKTVVIGYGQVGQAVSAALEDVGIPYTVVDRSRGEEIDVVGDGTDPETLEAAGIENAETVILALPDDTTTEFATLVVRDMAPEAQILARVERKSNTAKTYRAGADYVLSLSMVTGRLSASRLLEDRDVMSLDRRIEIVRERVPKLVGETIGELDIRDRTGCTVIAIERDGEVLTDVGPETRIRSGDELVVVGSEEGIRTFERAFDGESRVVED